jgi:hypothetical protein
VPVDNRMILCKVCEPAYAFEVKEVNIWISFSNGESPLKRKLPEYRCLQLALWSQAKHNTMMQIGPIWGQLNERPRDRQTRFCLIWNKENVRFLKLAATGMQIV